MCGEEVDGGVIARTHLRLDRVLHERQMVPGHDRDGQADEDAGDQDCQARADDTDEPARAQLHRGAASLPEAGPQPQARRPPAPGQAVGVITDRIRRDARRSESDVGFACFYAASPPTHNREPYDTLLYCPTSCSYRSVCGTDAACRLQF